MANPLIPMTPLANAMAFAAAIFNRVNTSFEGHVQVISDITTFVWANPFGLSPQQAANVLHSIAVMNASTAQQVFEIYQAAGAFLNAIKPGSISVAVPGGYQLAWNSDGSPVVTQLVGTAIVLTPASDTLANGTSVQFSAVVNDQFGHPLATQPPLTWAAGTGTIDGSGNYTAPAAAGTDTVTITAGTLTATAAITIQ